MERFTRMRVLRALISLSKIEGNLDGSATMAREGILY